MNRRLLTATFLMALTISASPAYAWPHHKSGAKYTGGSGTSRGCLTSSARALLGRIEAQFGSMQIISTCRPGARIAGTGRISRHASGNAIDFNAGGRKGAVVRWLIANHKSGGTMTYAGMSHVHVDVGQRFVSLGSGGRAGYRSGKRRYATAANRRQLAGTRYGLGMSQRRATASRDTGTRFIPSSAMTRMSEGSP